MSKILEPVTIGGIPIGLKNLAKLQRPSTSPALEKGKSQEKYENRERNKRVRKDDIEPYELDLALTQTPAMFTDESRKSKNLFLPPPSRSMTSKHELNEPKLEEHFEIDLESIAIDGDGFFQEQEHIFASMDDLRCAENDHFEEQNSLENNDSLELPENNRLNQSQPTTRTTTENVKQKIKELESLFQKSFDKMISLIMANDAFKEEIFMDFHEVQVNLDERDTALNNKWESVRGSALQLRKFAENELV
ncbi:hypothetical protein K7432_018114 [Basidiobolus ranarum]|uniref:Uncharacterized protein n=1 Tax=Basidiobolus ranarum TaxID=34480 RepID=A0ABR2WCJ5_9FUNG